MDNTNFTSYFAGTDMRYFARRKFQRNLIHKKKSGLIWQKALKLKYFFVKGHRMLLLILTDFREKTQTTIVFGNFVTKLLFA